MFPHHITANVTHAQGKIPEIYYGMKCVYGKTYKMDCNTCRCGHQNSLLCTKVACLPGNKQIVKEEQFDNGTEIIELIPDNTSQKKIRKIVKRRGSKRVLRTDSSGFPTLPPSRICHPGRIYQESCKRCFCKSNRQAACSSINACIKPKVAHDLRPEDVRPRVKDKEFRNLPALAHAALPCAPGTTYKIECNACVCDEYQNLICDKMMCLSFADMHRAEAIQKSGLPCNNDNFENGVIQSKCVECTCNGTTFCQAKENCIAEREYMMRSSFRRKNTRLAFNYKTEKCIPDHIYTDNCNKCYCQKDQTLRCTQKTCLNYNQAQMLEKEQQYLMQHGL